jgi:hypothetical protein
LAADLAIGPSANDGRKQACAPARMDEENAAGSEFRQDSVTKMVGYSLCDTAGTADEFVTRNLQSGMNFLEDSISIPSSLGKNTGVLRPDDQDRVECEDRFGIVQGAKACGEGCDEGVGIASELIDHTPRTLAGEDGDCVDVRIKTPADCKADPRGSTFVFSEAE